MARHNIPLGPPGGPGLGGPPISPHPMEQHGFPSFHTPSDTGRPPLPPSDVSRGRWDPNDNPFLSRDRDIHPSDHFHRDNMRRDFIDHHNLPPPPSEGRNGMFHHEENLTHWNDIPPLFGHGTETRDNQRQLEYHESFRGRSPEREYSSDRERGGRGYDTYGSSHHRSRARSPKPEKSVKERLGPTPSAEGRPGHHHRSTTHMEGRAPPDVEIIEHLSSHSRPSSVLSQSRGRHSPPPVHHHHPPEHRQRLEEGYNPFTVNERLGPPPPHPPPAPTQQPVPLFTPLADRLGGSPDAMARSVQARLGPPRITEPLDNNQGLVPFNADPSPLLSRSDARSPLPDLRQELDNYNPISRSMQSPSHLSGTSGGAVPLFRRSRSPSQCMVSPVRGPGSTSPTKRGPLSPIRAPSVSGRQALSPTPTSRSRPPSPPKQPPVPTGRPPSPPKLPPISSPPPSRHHSLPTKHLQSPQNRSTSPGQHPSSRPISPAKHTSRHAQSPNTSKSSKSPPQGEEGKIGGEEPSRSRRCSKYFSPPLSPTSGSRTKKRASTSNGSSDSRHSRSSPPPPSTSSRHSRRSSGKIKSPPSDSGMKMLDHYATCLYVMYLRLVYNHCMILQASVYYTVVCVYGIVHIRTCICVVIS